MVKIRSKQRAKPFKIHKGRPPKHLRKVETPISKMYGSLGLASSSNRKVSEDMGEVPVGNPEPTAPVAKPDYKAEGMQLWRDSALSRPTIQMLREGAVDVPLSEPRETAGIQRTLFSEVTTTRISDDDRTLVERFIAKYGEDADDYSEMSKDLEVNRFQFGPGQLRRLFTRYRQAQQGPVSRPANRILLDQGNKASAGSGLGRANEVDEPDRRSGTSRQIHRSSKSVASGVPSNKHSDWREQKIPAPEPVECMSIEEAQALARIFATR